MLNGFYAGIPDAVEGASYRQRGGVPAAVDIGVQPVGAEASLALCTLYHGPCAGIDGVAATRRSADHPGLPRPMLVSIAVPYAEPAADRRRSSWASSRPEATTFRKRSANGHRARATASPDAG